MIATLLVTIVIAASQHASYDPSQSNGKVTIVDAEFTYGDSNRIVPLRIYLPESKSAAPVVLFSHGLGGSRENNKYLGEHFSGRGYVLVAMQHVGSDSTVWKNIPLSQRMRAMRAAASAKSLQGRLGDVPATIDQLERWNKRGQKFAGRFDMHKLGMSGHSFGAVTTQAVSGQNYGRRGQVNTDKRIKAAIGYSPSLPTFGANAETFAKVSVPWLLMTGTKDKSAIGKTTPEKRREVYQQLPTGGHFYELVLDEAEHMAFSDRTLLGREQRNPNHHMAIKAISTAFWDAYLKGDAAAKSWIDGDGPREVLADSDLWLRK